MQENNVYPFELEFDNVKVGLEGSKLGFMGVLALCYQETFSIAKRAEKACNNNGKLCCPEKRKDTATIKF